jgi:hypothetical protein
MLRACAIMMLAVSAAGAAGLDDAYRIMNALVSPACTCATPDTRFIPAAVALPDIAEPPDRGQVIARSKGPAGGYCFQPGTFKNTAFAENILSYFSIPPWIPRSSFARLRFYAQHGGNPDADVPLIYYDSRTLYVPGRDTVWFFTGSSWMRLEGSRRRPLGTISITSDPAAARILLDGRETRLATPATLDSVPAGPHSIELHLADYRFNRRRVMVQPDTAMSLSFSLVSDLDTVFIRENPNRAVLVLSEPPLSTAYRIDNDTAKGLTVHVDAGNHRIRWDGRGIYTSIDTVLSVPAGQAVFFDAMFDRLTGGLNISVFPPDARIMLDDSVTATGEFMASVKTGICKVSVACNGYDPFETQAVIATDSMTVLEVALVKHADRDGDGFADTVDRCPDVYGIYDGCPAPDVRRAATLLVQDAWAQLQKDPFAVNWSLVGYLRKVPMREAFRQFLSNFDGGVGGAMNNYRGFTFGNGLVVSWKGLFASVELGQWLSGLRYRHSDTLTLNTATDKYLVYFDTLGSGTRTEPAVFIASTAPTIGFHLPVKSMNVCYGIGYQWENITIDDLRRAADGRKVRAVFSNNWWYHEIRLEDDIAVIPQIVPCLYFDLKVPFGPVRYTQWVSVQVGLSLKFVQAPRGSIGLSIR